MNWGLRKKILVIAALQLLIVVGVLFVFYYQGAKEEIQTQYVAKARSVALMAESVREEVGKKWGLGLFSAEKLAAWAENGEMDKVLASVPVVTAWKSAMAKSAEGGYDFKVPKFQSRNPKNEPDEFESRVLRLMEDEGLSEYHEIDESMNAIRYFRPIFLTEECMYCHGDPARSVALWGNDQGLDPTGVRMENWKVGELHGAFEVVQSLDEADAQITVSLQKAAGLVGVLLLAGTGLFFFALTRTMVKPMDRIIGDLKEGAGQVSDAASNVSESAQQLAAGASQQAASLEQTSAVLQQMSTATHANAGNAKNANELTNQSRTAAQEGNETIGQLNIAMEGINESSSRISKIIKVIEEIAFQTNLLALNAAVEAARAGEHGKGFAVVADEVRSLAQRAAEAARETTGLIEDSVQKAKDGTQVAGEVGSSLATIVDDVTKAAVLIEDISRASGEQAQSVEQVSSGMSEMDKVTQQNAASAEESAAAAEELTSMSASLKDQLVANLIGLVFGGKRGSSGETETSAAYGTDFSGESTAGASERL